MLTQPRQRINVATTAALLLAGMLAAPVLAAPERGLLCQADDDLTTAFTAPELTVTPVNSTEERLRDHLLRPDAKAAARSAFAEEAPGGERVIDGEKPEADDTVAADPDIQSTSEQKRPIYKRQMYRRDI
jgi:hypothetical protein